MALQAGHHFRRVGPRQKLTYWKHSQKVGLFHANTIGGGNDRHIAALMDVYGVPAPLRDLLEA
jgi:hypothetical protein